MNAEHTTVRQAGRDRQVTAKPCAVCGRVARFLDLPAGARITHTCPGVRAGASWTVYEPQGAA